MRNRRTIIIIGFILVVMYAFSHIEDLTLSISHHPIDGLYEPPDLNTDKLRRSLYSEPMTEKLTVEGNLRILQMNKFLRMNRDF